MVGKPVTGMKISLNRANKLRNKLEAMDFKPSVAYSVRTDQNLNETHATMEHEFEDEFTKMVKSVEVISDIRTLINKANNEFGVTGIIAKIVKTENLIKLVSKLLEVDRYGQTTTGINDLISKVNFQKEVSQKDETKVFEPSKHIVNIIDGDIRERLRNVLSDLKLTSEKLQEERNELNHKNTIQLPEDIVEFLRESSII